MATVSFKKKTEGEDTPPAQEQAVAVRPEQPLATPAAPMFKDFSGEWSAKDDVRYPRVNLVHKTSNEELITKFGIGSFILNKEVKLSDGKTPLSIVALHANKDLIQKKPFGDPIPPVVCSTVEEVVANGGTLKRKDSDGTNLFIRRAHITLVVPAPDGLSDDELALFPYEHAGKNYTMALFTVSSSAYTSVAVELATLRTENRVMQKGLLYGALALTSEDRKDAKNTWKVPVIKFAGANSDDLVAFYQSLVPTA